ncbi:hypothetical protein [Criibacterium bergeronii]|uniref:hypothetical protein n=1 Tax=Criibacterium bergeronii TaxID=1871336 RepID=UPI00117C2B8A|nr:hypothetical protein [Criibacterium bergeronii]
MKINPVNPRIDILEPIENSKMKPFKSFVEVRDIIGKNKSDKQLYLALIAVNYKRISYQDLNL